jgi:heme/copper-type cytochrome/quinol oxidase subunit 1
MFLAIPFDQQVTDTYFVVAHFHYIIFGAAVFPIFGGMYYWFPKVTGKLYFERPGQISFWIIFVGTNLLFFPMHIVGLLGMPRRVYTYPGDVGWTSYNVIESIGGYVTAVGILVLFANLVYSYFRGAPSGPDPWHGPTLEWTIPSPPPEYNFATIPTVTSAYPNWEDETPSSLALDQGHQQHVSTISDGWTAEIVEMPHSSPWPLVLAAALTVAFALLVVQKYAYAAIMLVVVGLALVAWHTKEPQEHA